jgi:hypothetical protein
VTSTSTADWSVTGEHDGLIRAVYGDWTILCASERRQYLDLIPRLAGEMDLAVVKEFGKSYRNHVALIKPLGESIVFKLSRRERFIFLKHLRTLIKDSEAVETLRTTRRLRRAGLENVYSPFLAMEKRRWKMIDTTILLYDYVDGPNCAEYGEGSLPLVVEALKKCHAMGCRHSDAAPKNFIIHDGLVTMIDSRFKRNVLGRFGEYSDFMQLEQELPAIVKYCGYDRHSLSYISARTYRLVKRNRIVRLIKGLKRRQRGRRFESEQAVLEKRHAG